MAVPRRSRAAVLLLLLLTLLLVSHCVHAAASKKGAAASGKSKSKSSPKTSEKKPAAAKKDWNKMTEDEWNAAEQDVLDPEDRWKPLEPPKPPDVPFDPKHPEKFMAAQKKGKPALMFAHLKNKTDATPYTKEETEKIAFEWQSLLVSAAKGGEPSTYVIEPGIILWSVQDGAKGYDIIDFCFLRPEFHEMEWENQKYRPGVPFINPNVAQALGGGLGKPSDDDDDD